MKQIINEINSLILEELESQELYNYATSNLRNSDINEKHLAWVIYCSNQSEQDAMINGLYGEIKNSFNNGNLQNINDVIENSNAIEWLNNLIQAFDYISKNKNNENLIKIIEKKYKKYNFNYNKFLKIAKNSISVFKKKIARTIFKTKKDFVNEHKNIIYNPNNIGDTNNFYII